MNRTTSPTGGQPRLIAGHSRLGNGRLARRASDLLWGVAIAAVLGGCGHGAEPLTPVNGTAEFREKAMSPTQPVIVYFDKESCPACLFLEPTMESLAGEYHGRAVFVKCGAGSSPGSRQNYELRDAYKVSFVPTVILLLDGQERNRWVNDLNSSHYRQALDAILGPQGGALAVR